MLPYRTIRGGRDLPIPNSQNAPTYCRTARQPAADRLPPAARVSRPRVRCAGLVEPSRCTLLQSLEFAHL